MEKIATLGRLDNYLSWGHQNILSPIEDVVHIKVITYNKRSHSMMKKTEENPGEKIIDPINTILYNLRIKWLILKELD